MVAISRAVILLGTAALSGIAMADNCKTGLFYCGKGLLNKGNYYTQIVDALNGATPPQPTDTTHVRESLFYCVGGPNGDITFQTFCSGGCKDGGSGKSDHC
ncbi:hypothetical protein B0T20DRAFT_505060 [Sordaria brevicollis]|uniref:Uncharacterized protein n=1 Tax=Sordaria brevicollis TaxID=83679 RepID=A0AAE0PIH7_SORBR|nr:hypothetical protein B0T20DRAFT_505060 [Sordaria brevicollis]